MIRNWTFVAVAALCAAGCSTAPKTRREAAVVAVAEDPKVVDARAAVAEAEDEFLATEQAVVEAEARRQRAKTQADVAMARVRQEEIGLELAKVHGDDVGRTRALEVTRSKLEAARAKVRYFDAAHAEVLGERLIKSAAVSLARAELAQAMGGGSPETDDAVAQREIVLAKISQELEVKRGETSAQLDAWRRLESRIGKGTREASAPVKPRGRPQL